MELPKDLVSHPGEMLREILEGIIMSPIELAKKTGFDISYISMVLVNLEDITDEFANKLEEVLGVSKDFWISLQNDFNKFKDVK